MCGICGILRRTDAPERQEVIERMTDALAHRGPNDRGIWRSGPISLGNRRLAVRDLSPSGHQPMATADGTIILTYNGEIYNSAELRERYDLAARGYRFRSTSDTEVLLYLLAERGIRVLSELDGMFALACWDAREQRLTLARDRFGIKPLFYQQDAEAFRFGSEIKSILADERVTRRVSLQALHDFLSFDYIPGPQTSFQGIFEVPPGHWLELDLEGCIRLHSFVPREPETDPTLREADIIKEARALLDQAVKRQLVSDVPVGVLLSGGMDSSALVGLMSRHTREPIHTFAIGFDEPSFDERPHARIVAQHFKTRHTELVITPSIVQELLPTVIRAIDEPYGDGSALPTYGISQVAKEHVVVLLSGEGGDELFGGYETYSAFQAARAFRAVPAPIRRGLLPALAGRLPVSDSKLSFEFRLKRFLGGQDLSPPEAHFWWRVVLTETEKRQLYAEPVQSELPLLPSTRHFTEWFDSHPGTDTLARLMRLDSAIFLPDDLMIKNDRMTMAHSLEARVPFTDLDLVRYMGQVPGSLRMRRGRKKHILRECLRGLLPAPILTKKKVGLEMPYSRWFKTELRGLLERELSPRRIHDTGLFRPEAVSLLVADHLAGRNDNGRALWGLLTYMVWLDALNVQVT